MKPEGKKQKGSRAEREWAKLIEKYTGTPTKRMPLSGAIQGLKGDIFSPGSRIHWEVKAQETTKFLEWYKQAEIDSVGGRVPIVAWTKNRLGGFFVFLKGEDFLELLKYALAAKWPDGVIK